MKDAKYIFSEESVFTRNRTFVCIAELLEKIGATRIDRFDCSFYRIVRDEHAYYSWPLEPENLCEAYFFTFWKRKDKADYILTSEYGNAGAYTSPTIGIWVVKEDLFDRVKQCLLKNWEGIENL